MSPSSPLSTHPPQSYDTLKSWLESRGGKISPGLEAVYDDTNGWNVKAKNDIERGAILCVVPKSIVLSHRTSDLTEHVLLPSDFSAADVTLHLAACLLYELLLGEESRFYPWLQILPRETVALPTFWGEKELYGEDGPLALTRLGGTEAERELQRKDAEGLALTDLRAYYDDKITKFPPTSTPPTYHSFLYAFSMVSTRGYITDAYHAIALIPFCDLFNHSSHPHTSLLSDQCVCPICGSLASCSHDAPGEDRISHLSPDYIAQTEDEGRNVEMRAERAIAAGDQVYSCYEEGLGDGKLLVEWGFLGQEKNGQGVTWRASEVLRREDGRAYMTITQRERVLRLLDEALLEIQPARPVCHLTDDPSVFNITADGVIGINILSACYLRSRSSEVRMEELEEIEDDVVRILQAVWRNEKIDEATMLRREVRQLVAGRLSALREGQRMDAPNPGGSLTGMADQLRVDEMELLQGFIQNWQ